MHLLGYRIPLFQKYFPPFPKTVMIKLNGWTGYEITLFPVLITISASIGCVISAPIGV